ncbi:hypothetical protein [Mucilaginibacter polytrichastri]|uniref:Uncharacterized protein n=1 Tax=Mucilaginibacter polytrichastri TaxID=1302689 RepID=A0A1Q6A2A3_9SPHI|nr:hypothetical protein [Mucilaginibacter polytrichastri]OKS88139.1 hypothetical protein RG47T_3603 [Mucilaginibacter polytrichastri]SFT09294.1 hypothetical protein SAMN04487890_110103 [Mucilaginibacter polytrichastri]
MEDDIPSAEETQLRDWLNNNQVYPGKLEMQSLVINSFYSEFEDQPNDDDLTPLDELDPDELGISEGFDYKTFEKSDAEEEQAWHERIAYALNNLDRFLVYINEEWRDLPEE